MEDVENKIDFRDDDNGNILCLDVLKMNESINSRSIKVCENNRGGDDNVECKHSSMKSVISASNIDTPTSVFVASKRGSRRMTNTSSVVNFPSSPVVLDDSIITSMTSDDLQNRKDSWNLKNQSESQIMEENELLSCPIADGILNQASSGSPFMAAKRSSKRMSQKPSGISATSPTVIATSSPIDGNTPISKCLNSTEQPTTTTSTPSLAKFEDIISPLSSPQLGHKVQSPNSSNSNFLHLLPSSAADKFKKTYNMPLNKSSLSKSINNASDGSSNATSCHTSIHSKSDSHLQHATSLSDIENQNNKSSNGTPKKRELSLNIKKDILPISLNESQQQSSTEERRGLEIPLNNTENLLKVGNLTLSKNIKENGSDSSLNIRLSRNNKQNGSNLSLNIENSSKGLSSGGYNAQLPEKKHVGSMVSLNTEMKQQSNLSINWTPTKELSFIRSQTQKELQYTTRTPTEKELQFTDSPNQQQNSESNEDFIQETQDSTRNSCSNQESRLSRQSSIAQSHQFSLLEIRRKSSATSQLQNFIGMIRSTSYRRASETPLDFLFLNPVEASQNELDLK